MRRNLDWPAMRAKKQGSENKKQAHGMWAEGLENVLEELGGPVDEILLFPFEGSIQQHFEVASLGQSVRSTHESLSPDAHPDFVWRATSSHDGLGRRTRIT